MYALEVEESLDRVFLKLKSRDPVHFEILDKKVKAIRMNPYQFKPLRGTMHGSRRVHIGKSFVLVYEIDEIQKTVRLIDYAHHDDVY